MAKAKTAKGPIQTWADKIGWQQRVKAVCKPCWELKYCPYGPLVEDFPIPTEKDERACRIFGHQCPVFTVAEPFTETREIRNVSRHIPRPMQFRVLKRDNQICAVCQKPVLDGDIHFDHIIPWSKGGPTEEHNIRLLCHRCNRRKGANFEAEYLIGSFVDHVVEPVDTQFVKLMLRFVGDAHEWLREKDTMPDGDAVAEISGYPRSEFEDRMAILFADVHSFFSSPPPREIEGPVFKALAERWTFGSSSKAQKLATVALKFQTELDRLVAADMDLIRRLGWPVKTSATERAKWSRT